MLAQHSSLNRTSLVLTQVHTQVPQGRGSPTLLLRCAGARKRHLIVPGVHPPCTCLYTCPHSRCSPGSGTSLYVPHCTAHAAALVAPAHAQHSTAQHTVQSRSAHQPTAAHIHCAYPGWSASCRTAMPQPQCVYMQSSGAHTRLASAAIMGSAHNPGGLMMRGKKHVVLTSTGSVRSSLSPTSQ